VVLEGSLLDSALFILLITISLPVLFITVPRQVRRIGEFIDYSVDSGASSPPRPAALLLNAVQSLVFLLVPAALGSTLAHRVGLGAPFFQALVNGEPLWPVVAPRILPTLGFGVGGALVFLAAYYGMFRSSLDRRTLKIMYKLRTQLGVLPRVLYGGIVEEIIIHWGAMSLLVWIGAQIVGRPTPAIVWASILVSGLLFALGHLPPLLATSAPATDLLIRAVILLNLWISMLHGWLFWQYGLESAMVAHVLFHLIWLPLDLRISEGDTRPLPPPQT
jgi:hypothetical protein